MGIRLKSTLKLGYSAAFTVTDKTSFNTVSARNLDLSFIMKMFVPVLLYFYLLFMLYSSAGHGPFSHMYDGMFIPKVRPGYKWKVNKCI